tara:strand:+ start:1542 stop:2690 length:1149 start_codon:yes stop_codon:yes gene_type:complete
LEAHISKRLINVKKEKEKVLLLGINIKGKKTLFNLKDSMVELKELTESAGAEVINTFTQTLDKHSNTYLGKGKLIEIKEYLNVNQITTVICDDELTPNQQLNLETLLGEKIKVLDRTSLILDIFASRAISMEGKLQVELAQHEYLLPRLAGQWTHLERLGGGIGTRGPGESQIETDRRLARNRINQLKTKLEKVKAHRQRYRSKRKNSGIPTITLTGYTNAGKSTLLNMLTRSNVLSEDKLFSTLDPTTRKVSFKNKSALITDTVGFIQKLPTNLIASFRATLEETLEADMMMHVIDVTDRNKTMKVNAVQSLWKELGLDKKPVVTILNKSDQLDPSADPYSDEQLMDLIKFLPNPIFCSATTGLGKKEILQTLETQIFNRV